MKKDIVDIVMEKEFIELTQIERAELNEFCATEEEYNQLKSVFTNVKGMSFEAQKPRTETKDRLDQLFDDTYPKRSPVWYVSVLSVIIPKDKPIYRQPLMQVAAVALLFLLVVPLFRTEMTMSDNLIANNEVVVTENENNRVVEAESIEQEVSVEDVIQEQERSVTAGDVVPGGLASSIDELEPMPTLASGMSSSAPMSDHPDGVFMGGVSEGESVAYSQPASESSELLDLLTATF